MDIEYLREYVALANEQSITKTARKMNVSVSTLSRHMAQIEQDLHVALLKHSNNFGLTKEGMYLTTLANAVVKAYDSLAEEAVRLQTRQSEAVTLYYSEHDSTLDDLVAMMFVADKEYSSKLNLVQTLRDGDDVLSLLESHRIDAFLGMKPDQGIIDEYGSQLVVSQFFNEPLVVGATKVSALARKYKDAPSIPLAALDGKKIPKVSYQGDVGVESIVQSINAKGVNVSIENVPAMSRTEYYASIHDDEIFILSLSRLEDVGRMRGIPSPLNTRFNYYIVEDEHIGVSRYLVYLKNSQKKLAVLEALLDRAAKAYLNKDLLR